MQHIPSIYVAASPLGGRGVFTAASVPEKALIEIAPMLVLKAEDKENIDATRLFNYYFLWGENEEKCAIALGYGSLYNHSFEPNARYLADFESNTLHFYALRPIEAGEEITVNYNGQAQIQDPLWFETR